MSWAMPMTNSLGGALCQSRMGSIGLEMLPYLVVDVVEEGFLDAADISNWANFFSPGVQGPPLIAPILMIHITSVGDEIIPPGTVSDDGIYEDLNQDAGDGVLDIPVGVFVWDDGGNDPATQEIKDFIDNFRGPNLTDVLVCLGGANFTEEEKEGPDGPTDTYTDFTARNSVYTDLRDAFTAGSATVIWPRRLIITALGNSVRSTDWRVSYFWLDNAADSLEAFIAGDPHWGWEFA